MSKHLFADIETLSTSQNAIILSLGMVAVDLATDFNYEDIEKFFVKFDVKEQKEKYGRIAEKDTMEWWNKQDKEIRDSQVKASKNDVSLAEGFKQAAEWMMSIDNYDSKNGWVWTRGMFESFILDHAAKDIGRSPLFHFGRVRDLRTAIDILSDSSNGYCQTTKSIPNIQKHDPVNDCILDAFMLAYPKE